MARTSNAVWAKEQEIADLQTDLRQARNKLDLLRELLKPGLEEAPNGPAMFVRVARQILDVPA